jgi:hypothetical protein
MRVAATDYFSAQSAERLVPGLDAAGTLKSAGIPDGYPFIVADNGTYEADLNRALRLMPSYGVRSVRSVRAYADVYVAAGRFLQGQPEPKTLWEATRDDFNVLFTVRRVDLATRQSKATWNLWVAALDKLYQIGVDEGLVAANPFPRGLRSVRGRYGRAVERNLAYEPDGGQRPVKYLRHPRAPGRLRADRYHPLRRVFRRTSGGDAAQLAGAHRLPRRYARVRRGHRSVRR